jgi:hypothetical protein
LRCPGSGFAGGKESDGEQTGGNFGDHFVWTRLGLRRDSPDGLYNYYIPARFGKEDFCESRRIFAKQAFA